MRFAEGPVAGYAAFGQKARKRVDHRGFQRFRRGQGRQDAGKPCGEHRLAAAGRADHEQVMPPGGGDFQRAFGAFLAFHLAKVAGVRGAGHLARFGRLQGRAAGVVVQDIVQRGGGKDGGRADPGGLGPAGFGAKKRPVFDRGGHGSGQRPGDGDQATVEREFAQGHDTFDIFARDDVERREEREGNGQVEMRAFLGQVGGRQVDGDPLGRQRDGQGLKRGAHPFAGFGHCLVGQADQGEGGRPGRDGALHFDKPCLDPFKGDGIGAGGHCAAGVKMSACRARLLSRRFA